MKYKTGDRLFSPSYGNLEVLNSRGTDGNDVIIAKNETGSEFPINLKENCLKPIEFYLIERLEDHIGEIFYSPILGECKLTSIEDGYMYFTSCTGLEDEVSLDGYGKYSEKGELMIFPSKENRSWETWIEMESEAKYTLKISLNKVTDNKEETVEEYIEKFSINNKSKALGIMEKIKFFITNDLL